MIEVNLLPEKQRPRGASKRSPRAKIGFKGSGKDRDPWTTALIAAAVIVPGAIGVLWWGQNASAGDLETRLDEATADSARLADLRAVSDSLTARRQVIRERVALVEQLDRNRFVWPHLMDEVSRALPQLAWLTSLQQLTPVPDVSIQIQGIAANPLAITEFVRGLEASDYIAEVRILGSQKQTLEDGDLVVQAFTLNARYSEPPGVRRTEPIIPSTGP